MTLPDIQQTEPKINIPINQVGVGNVEIPFKLESKYGGTYETVANISVRVNLDKDTKGISMSRCLRIIRSYLNRPLKQGLIRNILVDLRDNLHSDCSFMRFDFKLPVNRKSPYTDDEFPIYYKTMFEGQLFKEVFKFYQAARVQYASYCPCSAELCKDLENNGKCGFPHNQRSFADICIQTSYQTGYVWLEDIIELVENQIKTLPYPIIKRTDEQKIAEIAAQNPLFVEDAIRLISYELDNRGDILDWYVKCFHEESIHTSEAIAINYKGIPGGLGNNFDLSIK